MLNLKKTKMYQLSPLKGKRFDANTRDLFYRAQTMILMLKSKLLNRELSAEKVSDYLTQIQKIKEAVILKKKAFYSQQDPMIKQKSNLLIAEIGNYPISSISKQ